MSRLAIYRKPEETRDSHLFTITETGVTRYELGTKKIAYTHFLLITLLKEKKMKRLKNFVFALLPLFAFVGCAPDLVVKNLDVTWDAANKKAEAKIANIGNRDAGDFMVYFNGDENPVSPNRRPQVRHNVPGLAEGASTILDAHFGPLAHPDNNNLRNVYKITVLVDPKGMVKESNENNNVKEVAISQGMACVDFGPPPTAGTQYGIPMGNVPGDVVLPRLDAQERFQVGHGGHNGHTTTP